MNTRKIALYGIIIGLYVGLSLALGYFSFGPIQVRIAEVLVVLCLYKKEYTIPLTVACLITNVIGIMMGINFPLDFIFGTLATLISCLLVYHFKDILWFNKPILSLLMPCIVNGIIIGFEIMYYTAGGQNMMSVFFVSCLSVFAGEFVSCVILDLLLNEPIYKAYKKLMKEA